MNGVNTENVDVGDAAEGVSQRVKINCDEIAYCKFRHLSSSCCPRKIPLKEMHCFVNAL